MEKFAVAVKAFITYGTDEKDIKLLLLNNALDDPHRPGEIDLPGGRLNPGEDPYEGLKRELAEELGPEFAKTITIGWPIDVAHFERPDGQVVTMIFFHCLAGEGKGIVLSPEHSLYHWKPLEECEELITGKMNRAYMRFIGRDHTPYED